MLRWPVLLVGAAAAVVLAVEGEGALLLRAFLAAVVIAVLVVQLLNERRGVLAARLARAPAEAQFREYRHILADEARCIFWHADVSGRSHWESWTGVGHGPFKWDLHVLDRRAMEQLVGPGYHDDQVGTLWSLIRHTEDLSFCDRRFYKAMLEQQSRLTQMYRVTTYRGKVRWYLEDIRIRPTAASRWRCIGVCIDITEQRLAEQNLQDVMRLADCIIFHGTLETGEDVADASLHRWQMQVADLDAAQRLVPLEVKPGEGYVQAWLNAQPEPQRQATRQRHLEAILGCELHFSQSFCITDRHGQVHWMNEDVRLEPMGPGRFQMVSVCVEVTAQKQAELDLREARKVADEANAAKSQFLANMSHEIRTPMTAIVGYADLLCDPELSAHERETYVRTIRRNGEHLVNVVNDILDLSRIESGRLEILPAPCSPREIVEEVVSLLGCIAQEKGIDLTATADPSAPARVVTDPMRLRQIVLNLVGNAVKFTDRGGVSVSLSAQAAGPGEIRLQVEVADTGIGISPDRLPLLFQPFQQAAEPGLRRQTGSGLGLAISRRLAGLLGGDISVETRPGVGSRFTLWLNLALAEPAPAPAPESPAPPAEDVPQSLAGVRLLLAEDGADNRRLIAIHLRRLGCLVRAVENGQQAVDLAMATQGTEEAFDVVLMDMHMPVLDGYAATTQLRTGGFTRPIIALTAYAMEGDRQQCLEVGCDDYVVKPIDMPHLSRVIRQQVDQARGLTSR